MAVYFAPKQPNYWGRAAAEIGTGLLGKFVGDMFERTAQAKTIERNRSLYSDIGQAMQGGGSRETLLDVFSKHGVDTKTAENMINMYENPFKNRDEIDQMDIKADRVKGLPHDRNDPQGTYQGGLTAQIYGAKPEEIMKYTMPNYTAENFDAGDKEVIYTQDPVTGAITTQDHKYGLNPTKQYESDSDIKRANINAGASRYVADVGYKGKVLTANSKGGNGEPVKPLSLPDKKSVNSMIVDILETSKDPQEVKERIQTLSEGDPRIERYAKSLANRSNYITGNGVYMETKPNQFAGKINWDEGEAQENIPFVEESLGKAQKLLESTNGNIQTALDLIEKSGLSPEAKESTKALIRQISNHK